MVESKQEAEFFFRNVGAQEDAETNQELERLLEVFGEGYIGEIMINAKAKVVPHSDSPDISGARRDPYIRTDMEYKGTGEGFVPKVRSASRGGRPKRPV